jgi:1-deoxy-D-xylulose-5-phosphate reductoisomerase
MIETVDGAIFAHMGAADMAHPIVNALEYPRKTKNPFGALDLEKIGSLRFNRVDHGRYPALALCYEAGKTGGSMPAAMNAANEVAVEQFLARKISFTHIARVVESVMRGCGFVTNPRLDDIYSVDQEARDRALHIIGS